MPRYAGVKKSSIPNEQRVDTRRWGDKMADAWSQPDGAYVLAGIMAGINLAVMALPAGPVLSSLPTAILSKKFLNPKERLHNMPFRVPKHLAVPDGSVQVPNRPFRVKKNRKSYYGKGVTLFGVDRATGIQAWGTDSDNRTHSTILGTTGSGKTEFIFCLILNQLIEDSGFIAVDAKGDIAFQHRCCQLLRRFGREDDLLTISFAVGTRDFLKAQDDRPTNTFNIMSSTSAGMLIELLSGMLDGDAGGDDMWKGRAIAFIAAITRPLTYLRDAGDIELSPSMYMDYMELTEVERLVYEQANLYPGFDVVLQPLRGYLTTLPGYDTTKKMQQAQETNEQFGFITMQLTRAINDLGHNYGHIFGIEVGEIDISDVVLNRRCLTVLLPSLERSLPTLNMLGKLIIGSIKQMMAGSLGSQLQGLTRLIVDSRPTSANNSFRIILDEVGYMMVTGMSIIPAQARSLNISMTFAAQSYTDIKRGSAEEAEAIWDNSNIKFIGRIVGGDSTETWQKVKGAAGEKSQMYLDGYEQREGFTDFKYVGNKMVKRETKSQVEYQDVAGQENGEFTIIVPKKYDGGESMGVAVVRILGLYTGGGSQSPHMYINDLIPVSNVKDGSANIKKKKTKLREAIRSGSLSRDIDTAALQGGAKALKFEKNRKANIYLFIDSAQKEIDAHKANSSHDNVVLGVTLNLLASTLRSIETDKFYMPANLQDGEAQQHLENAIQSSVTSDITKSQAARAVQNFQKTAFINDRDIHSAPATFVYDQQVEGAENNPFDMAQPDISTLIQRELQKAYLDNAIDISRNQKINEISQEIIDKERIDDPRLAEQAEIPVGQAVEKEVAQREVEMRDSVESSLARREQLLQMISEQKTGELNKELMLACINDGISSPSNNSVVMNEDERERLHSRLQEVATFALTARISEK